MKRFYIVLLVLLTVMLTAVAVYAAPPERNIIEYENDRLLHECGDYDLRLDVTAVYEISTFFNREGNRIKELEHASYTHFIYRDGNMNFGLSESTSDNAQTWFDPDTGELLRGHFSGTPWNIHIPGVGPVFKVSGPAFYVDDYDNIVKEAGHYTFDGEALCAYFAS